MNPSETQSAADLRYCGVCWAGKDGVRMHYCDLPLGHGKGGRDHQCHCGEVLKVPAKLAGKETEWN